MARSIMLLSCLLAAAVLAAHAQEEVSLEGARGAAHETSRVYLYQQTPPWRTP